MISTKRGNWFNPQIAITLAIIAGVITIILKFGSQISDFIKKILNNKSDVEETDNNGKKINIDTIVERQYKAMYDFGTDFDELVLSLADLSPSNLEKVYKNFGKRAYKWGGRLIGYGDELDLFGWYNEELDDSEKNIMRQIWSKTKIQITF